VAEAERSPEPVEELLGSEPVEGTIAVSVRYYNVFRLRVGIERETIALAEGTSLRTALERLAGRHGSVLREMLFAPDGSVASHLIVFRNRKLVPHDARHLPLADGDELMLFPAVAGG
jgi:molybdopterin converting factor small subunit